MADAPRPDDDRPYHHGNLRQAIVDAAVEALAGSEPSQLSLRDLARRAGVAHSALYVHFRDRDDLLAVIAAQGFDVLAATLRDACDAPAGDRLDAIALAYLRFARDNPAHYRTMYRPQNTKPENADRVRDPCDECFGLLVGVLAEAPAIAEDERVPRAIGIWSALHGLALLGGQDGPLSARAPDVDEPALALSFAHALGRAATPARRSGEN